VPLGKRPGRGRAGEFGGDGGVLRATQGGGHVVAEPGRCGSGGEQPSGDRTVGRDSGERYGRMTARPQLVGDALEGVGQLGGCRRGRHAGCSTAMSPGDGDREQSSGQRAARACGEQAGDHGQQDGSTRPPRSSVAGP